MWVVDSRLNEASGQSIKIEWEVDDSGQGLRIEGVSIYVPAFGFQFLHQKQPATLRGGAV